jgi:DNA-binding transcriptional LysR family regulator
VYSCSSAIAGGTKLTADGAQLVPFAASVLDSIGNLQRPANGKQTSLGSVSRRFRIGLLGDGFGDATWDFLKAFSLERPDVELVVSPMDFRTAFQAVNMGLADAVLCVGPATETERQRVTTIGYEPVSAVLTDTNPLVGHDNVDLELIARQLTFDPPIHDPAFRRFWAAGRHPTQGDRTDLVPTKTPGPSRP